MRQTIDIAGMLLLLASVVTFALGVRALGEERDLPALYFLVTGALALRSATELLRPGADR